MDAAPLVRIRGRRSGCGVNDEQNYAVIIKMIMKRTQVFFSTVSRKPQQIIILLITMTA